MAVLTRKRAYRRVGIWFWSMAGLCFGMALLGLVIGDARFTSSGIAGGGWFTLLASLPRQWFVKSVDIDSRE